MKQNNALAVLAVAACAVAYAAAQQSPPPAGDPSSQDSMTQPVQPAPNRPVPSQPIFPNPGQQQVPNQPPFANPFPPVANSSAPVPGQADVNIQNRVRDSILQDDPATGSVTDLKVTGESGRVILRGSVRDAKQREAIIKKAGVVAGEGNVVDELEIKP